MKKGLNIFVSIFLLSLTLLPYLHYTFQQARKQAIRHEMEEKLEHDLLHTITIQNHQIKWVKPGKEIWVNNRMFDIKSINEKNGSTVFTGLYDEEETVLVHQINKEQRQQQEKQTSLLVGFFHLFNAVCYAEDFDLDHLPISRKLYSIFNSDMAFCSRLVITPPPRC